MGRDLYLSEIVATLQSVPGVTAIAVSAFGGVEENKVLNDNSPDHNDTTDALVAILDQLQDLKVNLARLENGQVRPCGRSPILDRRPST